MTTQINIQISDQAVKTIVMGACFIGACYLIYKVFQDAPAPKIDLPPEAKNFSQLPELSPDKFNDIQFNASIKTRAEKAFSAGDYCGAVRSATIGLFDLIRRKSGINADSVELIKLAFRGEPRRNVKPKLQFTDVAPSHITNMGSGLIDMLEGFAKSIRKVHMHAEITLSESRALQEISIACYLADFVEHNASPVTV